MNIGIIGCGFIAKKHAKAIENLSNAKLVAVCDQVQENMEYYKENYNVKAYLDFTDMLENSDIDIVCICTPSGSHARIAEKVAQAKKHLIIEKPIAMTLEETELIIKSAKNNGVKLSIIHPNRYRTAIQEAKKLLDQNLLGKISHANCLVNWNRNQEYYDQAPWRGTKKYDGGVLMNQAIHNLDILLWFMGKPEAVFSMEATRLRDIEAEDVSTGVIRFENGALANVQASSTVYSKNFEESITIFGEKGTFKIGGTNALYFEHLDVKGLNELDITEIKNRVESNPWGIPGHQRIIEDMIHSIEKNIEPGITGEDGERVLGLVLAFYKSAEIKKIVEI